MDRSGFLVEFIFDNVPWVDQPQKMATRNRNSDPRGIESNHVLPLDYWPVGWSVFVVNNYRRGLIRKIVTPIDKILNIFEFGESLDLSMNFWKKKLPVQKVEILFKASKTY
jgi:hypothetical protein